MAKTIVEEVELVLAATENGGRPPPLAQIEETLTTGYAHALALDAERLRLERRLEAKVAELGNGALRPAEEVARLASRISSAADELHRLRGLLDTLRVRARALRGDLPHAAA